MDTAVPPPLPQSLDHETLLMTADQLAQSLQVSKRSIWRLRDEGEIPEPIRLGGAVRWRRVDVEAWLANRSTSYGK